MKRQSASGIKSANGHTLDDDFAHWLAYSGHWRESAEVMFLLREAFEAAWNPQVAKESPRLSVDLDAVDKAMLVIFLSMFALLFCLVVGLLR